MNKKTDIFKLMDLINLKNEIKDYINSGYSLQKIYNYTFSTFGEKLYKHNYHNCECTTKYKLFDDLDYCEFYIFYFEFCNLYELKDKYSNDYIFIKLNHLLNQQKPSTTTLKLISLNF